MNAGVEILAIETLVETVLFEDVLTTVAMSHKLQAAFDYYDSLRSTEELVSARKFVLATQECSTSFSKC
jgi:hypothetical protein